MPHCTRRMTAVTNADVFAFIGVCVRSLLICAYVLVGPVADAYNNRTFDPNTLLQRATYKQSHTIRHMH